MELGRGMGGIVGGWSWGGNHLWAGSRVIVLRVRDSAAGVGWVGRGSLVVGV